MASTLPPVRGATYNFPVSLVSQSSTHIFQTNVTITTADVWVSKDGGAFVAATAAPTELLTGGAAKTGVLWQGLTATEMTADVVTVLYHDAAGSEWQDALATIYTAAQTLDTTDVAVDAAVAAIATAQADLDNPAQYKADVSGLATSAALAAVSLLVDDLETRLTAARAAKLDAIGTGGAGVTMISPVSIVGDTIQLIRGDDYALADGRSLEWSSALWPNLVGATIALGLYYNGASVLTTAGVVVTGGVGITQTVSVDLTAAQTTALVVGYPGANGRGYWFDVEAVLVGGHEVTLQRGTVTVLEDYTP